MGFLKRLKKKIKKVGKSVAKTAKKVGRQVERSASVAMPALMGPGLGQKISVGILHGGSKYATAEKSALKYTYKVGQYSGAVVQYGATIVASALGGPVLGAVANRVTGFAKAGGAYLVRKEQYSQGFTNTRPKMNWREQAYGLSSIVGAAAGSIGGSIGGNIGAQIGSTIGNVGGALAGQAIRSGAGSGSGGSLGYGGGSGASGPSGTSSGTGSVLPLLLVGGVLLLTLKG